ncbi:hypothetical protein EVAR_94111_1 [Eumeta japonica]|uniref:Uncharacterized protein n=1 Tax=Eumeta variegata TaxID=151549 RepID=A0A4C1U6Q7_EUMVA|nr:hypothetical protein EVAR_94111_1 [Eumeta japonica]
MLTAAHEYSQSHMSYQSVSGLLKRHRREGGVSGLKGKWATGTFARWMKSNTRSHYLTSVLCRTAFVEYVFSLKSLRYRPKAVRRQERDDFLSDESSRENVECRETK